MLFTTSTQQRTSVLRSIHHTAIALPVEKSFEAGGGTWYILLYQPPRRRTKRKTVSAISFQPTRIYARFRISSAENLEMVPNLYRTTWPK